MENTKCAHCSSRFFFGGLCEECGVPAPAADVKNPADAGSAEGGAVWGESVAQAPAASAAPSIDTLEFRHLCAQYVNRPALDGEPRKELVAHINRHVAAARKEAYEAGRMYEQEIATQEAEEAADRAEAGAVKRAEACDVPPAGWACTRTVGHSGPCAAIRAATEPEARNAVAVTMAAAEREEGWKAAPVSAAEQAKPFAYFVQPSGFGPFIECEAGQVGAFAAYRQPPADAQELPALTEKELADPEYMRAYVGEMQETIAELLAMLQPQGYAEYFKQAEHGTTVRVTKTVDADGFDNVIVEKYASDRSPLRALEMELYAAVGRMGPRGFIEPGSTRTVLAEGFTDDLVGKHDVRRVIGKVFAAKQAGKEAS